MGRVIEAKVIMESTKIPILNLRLSLCDHELFLFEVVQTSVDKLLPDRGG